MKQIISIIAIAAFFTACDNRGDAPNDEATIPQHDMRNRDASRPGDDNPVRDDMKGTGYDTTTTDTTTWPQPAR